MNERNERVEQCIMEAQQIREAVEELAETQDRALMEAYGIQDATDTSDAEMELHDTTVSDSQTAMPFHETQTN